MTETTLEEAKDILAQEKRRCLEECQQEINVLLTRYALALVAQIVVSPDGRLIANVVLVDAN